MKIRVILLFMNRLEGKRAIVTGAASGIGRATAILFAREGARVVASDIQEEGLRETVEKIQAEGGKGRALVGSAAEEGDVRRMVETCLEDFGGLEAFYANAGVSGELVPLLELTVADWMPVLQVNLIGPFLAIKHAALHMQEHGGGSIVCTASVAGLRSGAGPTPYSASKAAVINLVQTAANQLRGTGIRVNAICPGLIETGMTQPIFDMARGAGKEHKLGQLNPSQRAGVPEEIARTALFLASDESGYVNGQALAVDGGLSSSLPFVPGRLL
jgi:NAD(P)-dependent dehydrogenase (short-subunit alcohol dehydrogenase family)